MFGNTEVWVVVVEAIGDIQIHTAPTKAEAQAAARRMVITEMESTVPEYNPDGTLVVDLDDNTWLAELRDLTTQPWVTIEKHIVPINPVSQ